VTDKQTRILVGYNLYFTSDEVIMVAIEHAKAFNAKLYVISSIVGHSLDKDGEVGNVKAKARLGNLKARLDKENIPYEVHLLVRRSDAGSDLVRFAVEHEIDEMVIGFKVRSTIGEIIFGSNYRTMIAEAPCPVVTVHVPGDPIDE
jgi:nucleotide-binding universal stress UspA family protein